MVKDTISKSLSPWAAGYMQPAEWEAHRSCFTAWPAHEYAWGPLLHAAQQEFVEFVRAFVGARGQETITLLVDDEHMAEARAALPNLGESVVFESLPYGDIWLRDTGPVFLKGPAGIASVRFGWNGWGQKFVYPHDAQLSARIAALRGYPEFACDFVLEGGAVEVDGAGTCLTTRSCLLNTNRDALDQAATELRLRDALGATHVIWLDAGLANDHTDGHIDNIARFVAKGAVVCMQAHDADDPNRATLDAIATALSAARDATGERLRVTRIPSPGRILGVDGIVAPASYMNFYIGNRRVLMPAFGSRWDGPARDALQALFPQHEVVACSARAILAGGGTFHCMTQQEPLP
jgi:agmatine deiminase